MILVATTWIVVLACNANTSRLIAEYWYYFILGVSGAVVANSTGAGGGIIFIPFFSSLGITGDEALGTSLLIQCFGMTAGSISWLTASHIAMVRSDNLHRLMTNLLICCGLACIPGVIIGQYVLTIESNTTMILVFRVFSILFGIVLLYKSLLHKAHNHTRYHINLNDYLLLTIAAFTGALLTSWISIAVGEILALLLILRKFPTMVAIAVGVSMSSVSVLTAAFYHVVVTNSVIWEIVIFAAPGAITGGTFAYMLSERLGPARLKVFFATWILATGLTMQ